MNTTEKPSKYCPSFCEFVKHGSFECKLYTECWHKEDKEVTPREVEFTICGVTRRVTITGENEVFKPIWYLSDGSMLPKNYEIFCEPIPRKST